MILLQLSLGLLCLCVTANAGQYRRRFIRERGQIAQTEGAICITPLGDRGQCVSLEYCPEVLEFFRKLHRQQATRYSQQLQNICGDRNTFNNYPIVCCTKPSSRLPLSPTTETVLTNSITTTAKTATTSTIKPSTTTTASTSTTTTTTTTTASSTDTDCVGPSAEPGFCQPFTDCSSLFELLKSDPTDDNLITYLKSSKISCGSVGTVVCCPRGVPNIGGPKSRPGDTDSTIQLPTEEDGCGDSHQIFNKIVGGEDSQVGAWPWIALIGYDIRSDHPFRCGGTLLTARHVLTAAHCLTQDLSFVRLGEHDLTTESDAKHVDINVERTVGHPDFRYRSDNRFDIAMLYLEKTVVFTDAIVPICMPMAKELRHKSYVGYTPFVAGWGRTENGTTANVLQQLQIHMHQNSVCRNAFAIRRKLLSQQQFDESVLCAGILLGDKDSCRGDSGGPLMIPELYKGTTRYYLIGIVSYGIGCGVANVPGVYTSTQYYMDWILEHINESPLDIRIN